MHKVCGCTRAGGEAGGGGKFLDGPGRYELVGFISHMGANTACGHYVAHVKKVGGVGGAGGAAVQGGRLGRWMLAASRAHCACQGGGFWGGSC